MHMMFIPLAEPPDSIFPLLAAMSVTPEQVIMVGGALATLWLVYSRINGAKKEFVKDVLAQLKADAADEKTARTPQPFVVKAEDNFARAEVVAEMHAQIIPREKLEADFERIETELHATNGKLDSLRDLVELRFKELDHKRSVSIANLHNAVTSTKERVAAAESQTAANTQHLHALDQRVDAIRNGVRRPS